MGSALLLRFSGPACPSGHDRKRTPSEPRQRRARLLRTQRENTCRRHRDQRPNGPRTATGRDPQGEVASAVTGSKRLHLLEFPGNSLSQRGEGGCVRDGTRFPRYHVKMDLASQKGGCWRQLAIRNERGSDLLEMQCIHSYDLYLIHCVILLLDAKSEVELFFS